jgi:transposase-like protein
MFTMKATPTHPYPENFDEFLDWFATEDDCLDYLAWIRWPTGFRCPKCGHDQYWKMGTGLRRCTECEFKCSVKAGTIFEDGHKSLRLWFNVMWLLMAQKTGMSAQNFHDAFGFGSYQTSWGWLQKLRSVMIRPGRELLDGRIELDETYVGGRKEGKRGRGAASKALVLTAIEGEKGGKLGRVRFRVISSHSAAEIKPFVEDYIKPGAIVVTDGLKSYSFLEGMGFQHETCVMSSPPTDDIDGEAESNLEHVHLVVSLLKRWLLGTHQGAVTPHHLHSYLDEFAFRFNRRTSTHRGKLFYRLMQQAAQAKPTGIKDFYVSGTGQRKAK